MYLVCILAILLACWILLRRVKLSPALLYDNHHLAIVAAHTQGISLPLHLLHKDEFWAEVSARFVQHSHNSARDFGLCAYQILLEKHQMNSPKLGRPETFAVQRPKNPLPIVKELPEINSK